MAYLLNTSKNKRVFSEVIIAKTFWDRSKGLLGRASLSEESVMWILDCNWIHTYFMQFPIDAVFVDRKLIVKAIKPNISPQKLTLPSWGSHSVFEMKNGLANKQNIEVGDQLYVGA